jgi:beta-1,2-mannobiose phosphorylase / 1,2-beta-oligomannan phosphorylase
MQVNIKRKNILFAPDPTRIIARFSDVNEERSAELIRMVLKMSEKEVSGAINKVLRSYSRRHRNISRTFEKNFNKLSPVFQEMQVSVDDLSLAQRALIGSYFTMEYSIEAAAFFNPSIVEHPDQSETGTDEKRVILSFRGTGEGHISSLIFRSGILDKNNDLTMETAGTLLAEADVIKQNFYDKNAFRLKLEDMQKHGDHSSPDLILDHLENTFTYTELMKVIENEKHRSDITLEQLETIHQIMLLATSHYEILFSIDSAISERVIFPLQATEKNGIEDARFVRFDYENGEISYYATYTAYDGIGFRPKLISTRDFYNFKVLPLSGEIVRNKGMALFPRKVDGKFVMLCRIDGVNNYISFSDSINVWHEARLLQKPKYSWEMVKIGNAGSPIETPEGWLVITHAVGPMREYNLGASLFELENPEKEIGRLDTPLIVPNQKERDGYVPNVIYSCGSMIHNNDLVIPYAISDFASTYATVDLRELLNALKGSQKVE